VTELYRESALDFATFARQAMMMSEHSVEFHAVASDSAPHLVELIDRQSENEVKK
jgi:hypothetical protein